MWRNRNKNQINGFAVGLFVVSGAIGLGLTAALDNRAPLIAGLLVLGCESLQNAVVFCLRYTTQSDALMMLITESYPPFGG